MTWMSFRRAAEHAGISERTLRDWVALRGCPSYKIGGKVLFDQRELDDWIRKFRRRVRVRRVCGNNPHLADLARRLSQ